MTSSPPSDNSRAKGTPASSRGQSSHAKQPVEQPGEVTSSPSVLDHLASIWLRFDRFGWDILGVFLLAVALLTLIGLINLTRGALIVWWTGVIAAAFGWVRFFVPFILGALALLALRKPAADVQPFPFTRVLALEGAFFTLLSVLAMAGGLSLERAETGMDGGVIGWALGSMIEWLLPSPLGGLFAAALCLYLLIIGVGLMERMKARIEAWLWPDSAGAALEEEQEEPAADTAVTPAAARTLTPMDIAPPAKSVEAQPRSRGLPPMSLLAQQQNMRPDERVIHQTAMTLERTLAEFGIPARVAGYRIGPTVTQFAVEPGFIEKTGPDGTPIRQKVRVSQISGLSRDLALALSAQRLRIEAPVPGRSYVGIEVPNSNSAMVRLRSVLESEAFRRLNSSLAIALGQDVSGQAVVADLARMPHLLIAGTTGSGKSVCIAALTACLVMTNRPEDLRLAMLDPKMVELLRFNGLPHLLGKVETQLERMLGVLRWALAEMDHRYRLLEDAHARDLEAYNRKMERRGQPRLPRIVVLVDELADLMMSAPDQTEHSLVRLAQMARATGIHLVVATQRPSTDVVTGLIKANFPARIAFTVASSIDSRVILDTNGAETLLGRGDMLFLNPENGTPQRAQGVMVSDEEIEKVLGFWKKSIPADAAEETPPWEELIETEGEEGPDSLVEQAIEIVRRSQHASASMLQRRLRIGYPRAARLMDELEELGVVGPGQGFGKEREVLLSPEDDEDGIDAEDAEGY